MIGNNTHNNNASKYRMTQEKEITFLNKLLFAANPCNDSWAATQFLITSGVTPDKRPCTSRECLGTMNWMKGIYFFNNIQLK